MSKLQAILGVYGISALNKDKTLKVDDEIFNAWAIENLSKKELLQKFSKEEIENIYYEAI